MSEPGRAEFEERLFEHLAPARAFALRLARDGAAAEDLVQEASLQARRSFADLDPGASFKAWLFGILRRTIHDAARTGRARPGGPSGLSALSALSGPAGPAGPSEIDLGHPAERYALMLAQTGVAGLQAPEEALAGALHREDVEEALDEMPEDERLVLHLCLLEGLGYGEAAEALDVSEETVMSRLHLGRTVLQTRLLERIRTRNGGGRDPAGTPQPGLE